MRCDSLRPGPQGIEQMPRQIRFHLLLLLSLLASAAAGCAGRGEPPRFPGSTLPGGRGDAAPSPLASSVVETALALEGAPYRYGGRSPAGFDCSGLVYYVFSRHGIELPATAESQWEVGRSVGRDEIAAGDLVFFVTSGRSISHVGIAIDGESFIHAPNSNSVVRVDRLDDSYWSRRIAGARRIAAGGRAAPPTGARRSVGAPRPDGARPRGVQGLAISSGLRTICPRRA